MWERREFYSKCIDEMGFTKAMIDVMVIEYGADLSHMYASGFSLGDSLMWDLLCDLGDRFAAIGSVAANIWP